jgi:hypothetical protein
MTVETTVKTYGHRVQDAERLNPAFNASGNEMMGSLGRTASYLTALWDKDIEVAPNAWIATLRDYDRWLSFTKNFYFGNNLHFDLVNGIPRRETRPPITFHIRGKRDSQFLRG